jgi:hypothetical protein
MFEHQNQGTSRLAERRRRKKAEKQAAAAANEETSTSPIVLLISDFLHLFPLVFLSVLNSESSPGGTDCSASSLRIPRSSAALTCHRSFPRMPFSGAGKVFVNIIEVFDNLIDASYMESRLLA